MGVNMCVCLCDIHEYVYIRIYVYLYVYKATALNMAKIEYTWQPCYRLTIEKPKTCLCNIGMRLKAQPSLLHMMDLKEMNSNNSSKQQTI